MLSLIGLLAGLVLNGSQPEFYPAAYDTEAALSQSEQDRDALLKSYDSAMFGKRFEEALKFARQYRSTGFDDQAFAMALQASALAALKRDSEARAMIAKAEQLVPHSVDPSRVIFVGALISDRPEFAAEALDRLIDRAPDVVRDVDPDLMFAFLRNEPKGQERRNEDRRIALAQIGYGGDTDVGHGMAARAVGLLAKRGDYAAANELLQYAGEVELFENLLILKRNAPLWPRAEQLAGPHLQVIRNSSVRTAERAFREAPDDHQKLQQYANALRHAGRLDEAIALRSKLPATTAQMSSADEQMGWAVNNVALALHSAGRAEEADKLFAMLNEAPMPKEYWRVSMKINRLELLVQDGKFDRALPLIEPTAQTEGSLYADQLTRRLRYCTLSKLGRQKEAADRRAEMLKHAADAPGPTIDGLLCAGEIETAEQIAHQTLKGEKADSFEEDFVRHLQVRPLTSDDPSIWQGRWQELRARPAIHEAFERLGRDLPAQLLAEPTGK